MTAAANPDPSLTVEELAAEVGMTVRNLREWRTLGLVPPAELRGRVGYYDPSVVDHVRRVQKLHAEGFTLELIRRMLDAAGESAEEVMSLAGALRAPFREEAAPEVDLAELAKLWGTFNPALLDEAIEIGLVRRRADGKLAFTSARAAHIGRALHDLGLSAQEALDAAATIRGHADRIAELFERVWRRHIWQDFLDAGKPPEEVARLREVLATVQPLALDAVIALFTVAMEARIEEGIAREVERETG